MIDHEIRNVDDGGPRRVTCKYDECGKDVYIAPGEKHVTVTAQTHMNQIKRHYCSMEHAGLDCLERSETAGTEEYKWKRRINRLNKTFVVGVLE